MPDYSTKTSHFSFQDISFGTNITEITNKWQIKIKKWNIFVWMWQILVRKNPQDFSAQKFASPIGYSAISLNKTTMRNKEPDSPCNFVIWHCNTNYSLFLYHHHPIPCLKTLGKCGMWNVGSHSREILLLEENICNFNGNCIIKMDISVFSYKNDCNL